MVLGRNRCDLVSALISPYPSPRAVRIRHKPLRIDRIVDFQVLYNEKKGLKWSNGFSLF
jgi:hypothetical protein